MQHLKQWISSLLVLASFNFLASCSHIAKKYDVKFPEQAVLVTTNPKPGDVSEWYVYKPFHAYINNKEIIVPDGMITDLSSVPVWFQGIPGFTNDAPYVLRPSLIHDWLYTYQGQVYYSDGAPFFISKDDADHILVDGMRALGATQTQIDAFYWAVHKFGQGKWDAHRVPH
jgi:hypothetical protein